jgi:hypothetical protein
MSGSSSLPWSDLRGLANVLLHGTPESRRAAALRLLEAEHQPWLTLLIDTVRSSEEWRVRARCLEALGMAAGESDQHVAERILAVLLAPVEAPPKQMRKVQQQP